MALPPTEATSPVLLGIELGRAPNATPIVVSGTGAPKVRQIIAYVERRVKNRKVVPQQGAPTFPVLLGIDLGRAPNVTRTVVSGTGVLKVMKIIAYFERRVQTRKLVPQQGAPNVTRSVGLRA